LNSNLTYLLLLQGLLGSYCTAVITHSFLFLILTYLKFIFLSNNPKSDTLPKKKRDVSNFDLIEFPNSTISRANFFSDADKNLESM